MARTNHRMAILVAATTAGVLDETTGFSMPKDPSGFPMTGSAKAY